MSGISEEELIKQITPYFKQAGFRKKNKRWTKDLGEFTLIFFIQGSCYCKEDYYIRPGVKVNHADDGKTYYGDFWTELPITDADTIIREFETFCAELKLLNANFCEQGVFACAEGVRLFRTVYFPYQKNGGAKCPAVFWRHVLRFLLTP